MAAVNEVVERDEQAELAFDVEGMSCTSCVPRVERALSGATGVTRARVNYATSRAEVVVDSAQVDVALLQAAVERAGYGLAEIDDEPGREARAKGRT